MRRFLPALLAPALLAAAPADIRLNGRSVHPESLDADRAGTLYVGSVQGIVYRAPRGSTVAEPWIRPDARNGLLALLGVLVDEKRRTLWVCSSAMPFRNPPAVGNSELVAFDLTSGALKRRYPFPGPAAACNDIAVAKDGTVFVTDTAGGRIFTVGKDALVPFADDPALRGVDGIAFAGDGTLYVNNVRTNLLQRIDRQADGAFAGVTTLQTSQPLAGPDGLRPLGGNRFVQAEGGSGRVAEVTITGDRAAIRPLREGLISSPGAMLSRGTIYAVEGKIGYLIDPKLKGQDAGDFLVRAIPYRRR